MQRTPRSSLSHAGYMPGEGRPPAPGDFSEEEAEVWNATAEAMPAGWFSDETLPLLRAYCVHSAMHQTLTEQIKGLVSRGGMAMGKGSGTRMANLEKLMRLQALQARSIAVLAQRMRLSQQSRVPKEEAEARTRNQVRSRPWRG